VLKGASKVSKSVPTSVYIVIGIIGVLTWFYEVIQALNIVLTQGLDRGVGP
jgi:hypothetical protein